METEENSSRGKSAAQERGFWLTWGFWGELYPAPPGFVQNGRYKYEELRVGKTSGGNNRAILSIKDGKIVILDYGDLVLKDRTAIDEQISTYNATLENKGTVQITGLHFSDKDKDEWELSGHGQRLDDTEIRPSKGGRTKPVPRMLVTPDIREMLDKIVIPQRGPHARIDEDPVWGIEGFADLLTLITPGLVAAITTANLPDLLGSSSWDRSQFDLWFMACVLYAWSREDKSDWPSNLSIARIARLLEPRVKDGVFDFEGMTLEDWKQYLWEATSRR